MCTLTTSHGIKWEMTMLNGKVAYQRDALTVLWLHDKQAYVVIDAMAKPVMFGNLQDCLESVRYNVN